MREGGAETRRRLTTRLRGGSCGSRTLSSVSCRMCSLRRVIHTTTAISIPCSLFSLLSSLFSLLSSLFSLLSSLFSLLLLLSSLFFFLLSPVLSSLFAICYSVPYPYHEISVELDAVSAREDVLQRLQGRYLPGSN